MDSVIPQHQSRITAAEYFFWHAHIAVEHAQQMLLSAELLTRNVQRNAALNHCARRGVQILADAWAALDAEMDATIPGVNNRISQ